MNVYQVETLIQLNVVFYNTALNLPADPTAVALFVEDPNANVIPIASNLIVRTGTGAYYYDFLPTIAGEWRYKWQGTGNVVATSRDTKFYVKGSELVS